MSASTESPQRKILFLSLDHQSFFDDMCKSLIDSISSKATIQRATKRGPALRHLQAESLSAIFITDPGITESSQAAVLDEVVEYVREGGIAIIGGLFSSFVKPLNVKPFFQSWGLPWETGDYHRTNVFLNQDAMAVGSGMLAKEGLEAAYSQKAVFLKNVAKEAALYLPNDQSTTQSMVFASQSVDVAQTPVAFTELGKGWLGYVGDVNAEKASDKVIMAMFGL